MCQNSIEVGSQDRSRERSPGPSAKRKGAGASWPIHLATIKAKSAFGRRVSPAFVTLYVTTRCDEKCIHCFYWDELNPSPNRDFTLDEFARTFSSMGRIYNLFIGGGEPFLRPDLGQIIQSAVDQNGVANVYVPTNGQHTERTVEVVEKVLSARPQLRFHLNLSVDHSDPEEYDRIRGRSGAWRRMNRTAQALETLRAKHPGLILHTLTTVMKHNQDQILKIHYDLVKLFRPDGASYNYCRGNPLDPEQVEVSPDRYRELVRKLEDDYRSGVLGTRTSTTYGPANHLLDQLVRRTVEQTVLENRAQFSCVAGRLSAVIYSDGRVVECETKETMLGNLRDYDYDFGRIWSSQPAVAAAEQAADGCFCTHECSHYASNIYSVKEVAKIAAKALLGGR